MPDYRLERDSLGEVQVPAHALYQAQTQRARENFRFSRRRFPAAAITAIIDIKAAAAAVNGELGVLDASRATAIATAAAAASSLDYERQFPLDVFQTGSGTSSNMNVNEVLATLAGQGTGGRVHPNDHVNLGQSSNDVVPAAIQLACARQLRADLYPALDELQQALAQGAARFADCVKTGRTHLMDAMPVTLGQEFDCWRRQLLAAGERLRQQEKALHPLPLGGTAVGTGVNTHAEFAPRVAARLATQDGIPWCAAECPAAYMSAQDHHLALAGGLKVLAVALLKIANDLRWMNSGPVAGLGEVVLPALQPGSSIMPGKVNPVIPEAVAMVAADVIGHEAAVTAAAQSGNFQLNVMLPLIADKLLESIELLANACVALARKVFPDLVANRAAMAATLALNPILATALNAAVGYDRAAVIAKRSAAERRAVLEIALEETGLSREQLVHLLDPLRLAEPHTG